MVPRDSRTNPASGSVPDTFAVNEISGRGRALSGVDERTRIKVRMTSEHMLCIRGK